MSERQFLYRNKQIATKYIFPPCPLPPERKKFLTFCAKNTICFRFHEVVAVTVDGKGGGSCLKTEKQCNWTSNFLKLFDLAFFSTRIWKSRTPPIVPRRL